jgi:hypothetical protein
VEELESRLAPTIFSWNPALNSTAWNNPQNWFVLVGNQFQMNKTNAWPGFNGTIATTTDTAIIQGSTDISAQPGGNLVSLHLSQLNIRKNFTGVLTLGVPLSISNGGLIDGGTIIQDMGPSGFFSDNGQITLTGGTLTWNDGTVQAKTPIPLVNDLLSLSTFDINGGSLVIKSGTLKSDLTVNKGGTLQLGNLELGAVINNNGGTISFTGSGSALTGVGARAYIRQFSGTFLGNNVGYRVNVPVDLYGGTFTVQKFLRISPPANQYGLILDDVAGSPINIQANDSFVVDGKGIDQIAGTVLIPTTAAPVQSDYTMTGGTLQLGSKKNPDARLRGLKTFAFESGTIQLYFNNKTSNNSRPFLLPITARNITIAKKNTTITVDFFGGGAPPSSMYIMSAQQIRGTAGTNPGGYGAQIMSKGRYYVINKKGVPPT